MLYACAFLIDAIPSLDHLRFQLETFGIYHHVDSKLFIPPLEQVKADSGGEDIAQKSQHPLCQYKSTNIAHLYSDGFFHLI